MKGTSGAAERVLLRGRVREAALKIGCAEARPRQASLWMPSFRGASSAEASPASGGNSLATGGARANRVGEKLPRRAIARGRSCVVGLGQRQPLARDISAGCAPKGARPPAPKAATEATPARWAGLDRSSSCARNSFRLQTSPSGARSSRPRVNSP
jgi:hypothetical protein